MSKDCDHAWEYGFDLEAALRLNFCETFDPCCDGRNAGEWTYHDNKGDTDGDSDHEVDDEGVKCAFLPSPPAGALLLNFGEGLCGRLELGLGCFVVRKRRGRGVRARDGGRRRVRDEFARLWRVVLVDTIEQDHGKDDYEECSMGTGGLGRGDERRKEEERGLAWDSACIPICRPCRFRRLPIPQILSSSSRPRSRPRSHLPPVHAVRILCSFPAHMCETPLLPVLPALPALKLSFGKCVLVELPLSNNVAPGTCTV